MRMPGLAAHQGFDGDILVNFRPMDAHALADKPPIFALGFVSVAQAGEPLVNSWLRNPSERASSIGSSQYLPALSPYSTCICGGSPCSPLKKKNRKPWVTRTVGIALYHVVINCAGMSAACFMRAL